MKNLFDRQAADEIVSRIQQLTPETQARWGKMSVVQMIDHCSATMEVVRDLKHLKRLPASYLIGQFMKGSFTNDKPYKQGLPTHATFVVPGETEIETAKQRLIDHIVAFQAGGPQKCTEQAHAFFGKLSKEQWATGMYKHVDHHLTQFGV